MKFIQQVIKIALRIYSARLGKDISLPIFNQIVQLSGSLCYFVLHVYSFKLLTAKFSFPGWTQTDLWVLLYTFQIFTYSAFFIFWKGFIHTIDDINSGSFDLLLSKPLPTLFLSFFRGGGIHNLICILMGFCFLGYLVFTSSYHVSFLNIISYLISLVSSLWIFFSISASFISLNLKYGRLNSTQHLMFQMQETYKYPPTSYTHYNFIIFVLFTALSLLTSLPSSLLLSRILDFRIIVFYILLVLLSTFLVYISWNRGLRNYSSASS